MRSVGLRWMARRGPAAALVAFLAAFLWASTASAQATTTQGEVLELDVQTFSPAAGPYSIFTVETSRTLGHLEPTGGVVLNYASEPFVLDPPSGDEVAIVDQQLAMHVLAGIGLYDIAQVDLAMPVYFVNDGDFGNNDIESGVVGDLSIRPKVTILDPAKFPVGLGGGIDFVLPTGQEQALVGDSSVEVAPRVFADYTLANVTFAANMGVRFQEDREFRALQVGERFEYGLGAEAEFLEGLLRVGGELYGRSELSDPFADEDENPLEGIVGAKVVTDTGFAVSAGAGGGLVGGVGAPEFRAFLGLRYSYMENDSDNDDIRDSEDQCPEEAEDLDGFEDGDGCPDIDNDGDGVDDINDQCPQTPGPAENDGCPPEEPDFEDADEDNIADEEDQCPDEPEDYDGFEDEDGCPDLDNDQDTILDEEDKCLNRPEDIDGYKDDDGCPDPDNDLDGILDEDDKCPDEPGLEENDGCPPEEPKAVREKERIKLLEKVFFETDKAVIKAESYNLLQQVGLIIRANPDIKRVEIAGHTDSRASKAYNQKLSEARAKAVKTFLVEQANVEAERLEAKGYGETEPLVEGDSKEAMAKNRRVEFKIVEQGAPKGDVEKKSVEEVIDETEEEQQLEEAEEADEAEEAEEAPAE